LSYFKDKVAIITGGASGVGRALCEQLGRNGAMVVVVDIDNENAENVVVSLAESGGKALAAQVDVSKTEEVQKLIDVVVEKYGRLDYLFNNAGALATGETKDFTIDDWKRVIDTNLYGVVNGIVAAYPHMVRQGFGHIVNTASLAGLVPLPLALPYTASKHSIVGLSHALRVEAAGLGIKVSVVCPGKINNQMKIGKEVSFDPERTNDFLPQGISVNECARIILRGVRKNKSTITVSFSSRVLWVLYRFSPGLTMFLSTIITNRLRNKLKAGCN